MTDIKQAVHAGFEEIPFIVVRGKCTRTLAFAMVHEEHTIGKFTAVPYVQPSPRPLQGQHEDRTLYANTYELDIHDRRRDSSGDTNQC